MPTKSERDLEDELGPSPNPFFAKKDEPWKDPHLMLKLEEKHDYQYEIAHILGCTPSKVSYWMDKAYENWEPKLEEGATECMYFGVCGYETIGTANDLCDTCLDLVRHNDSRKDIDPADSETMDKHMETLYAEYDQFDVNKP